MKKPFVLFPRKNQKVSESTKKRLQMPMKNQVRECEWLVEPNDTSPELSLNIAVLQRAVLDLITPGVKERDRTTALMWIKGELGDEHEVEYSFSFSRIVESFTDMSVEDFRSKVLKFVRDAQSSQDTANEFRFQRG